MFYNKDFFKTSLNEEKRKKIVKKWYKMGDDTKN